MAAFLKKHNQPDGSRNDICSAASALCRRAQEFAYDDPVAPAREFTPAGKLFSVSPSTSLGKRRLDKAGLPESFDIE